MVFGWKISLLYSPSTIQWLKRLSVSFSSQNFSGFSLLDGVCHHTRKQSINKRDHRDKRNGITLRFKYTQLVYYKWIDHLLVSNKRTDVFLERISTLALYGVCSLIFRWYVVLGERSESDLKQTETYDATLHLS